MINKKNNNVTPSPYWKMEEGHNSTSIFYKLIFLLNSKIISKFGYTIKNRYIKKIEQNSFLKGDLLNLRNVELSTFLSNYFTNIGISSQCEEIKKYINEFDIIFRDQPTSDLSGGMGYNNGLFFYILLKLIQPQQIVESGVWKGFTTYLIDSSTSQEASIQCFDINLSLLEYKSSKAKYYEFDINDLEHSLPNNQKSLAFFDDHVSHYDRLLFCIKNKINFVILDDDITHLNVHSDGWPPIPSANMIFNYNKIPLKFKWVLNGSKASANIQGLDVTKITNFYSYHTMPELFNLTGYKNSSLSSFLISKKINKEL